MIRINLLSKVDKAMIAARLAIYNRPFSERHPELGKMVNCAICDRRHRDSIICIPKYATGRYAPYRVMIAPDTKGGILGRAQFKGKRIKQHHKKGALQLVQLTQTLFPQYEVYITDPVECMKLARRDAARILKDKRARVRKFTRAQQDIARRINVGLARPGSRATLLPYKLLSSKTRAIRSEKLAARTKRNAEEKANANN